MSEKRKKYDREFREGAVRIVNETGKPVARVGPATARRTARNTPLFEGRGLVAGAPAAYLCRGFVCDAPTTDASTLAHSLRITSVLSVE